MNRDARVPSYNGFLVEVFESSPRKWRARVRRADGFPIETFAGTFESVTTGLECPSVEDAISIAKGMVDVIVAQEGQRVPTRH